MPRLEIKSGGTLQVKVSGLGGAKTTTFSLTGLAGKYDLGQFSISSNDFTQVLQIPAELPAGSYRLTVEGGENSAKVVIAISRVSKAWDCIRNSFFLQNTGMGIWPQ
jgi:hypothetical protein